MAKPFQALLLRGCTISIITAHVPILYRDMWPSLGPGPDSQVTAALHWLACEIATDLDEIREREHIESTALQKRVCQCTDGLNTTPLKWPQPNGENLKCQAPRIESMPQTHCVSG